MMIKFITLKTMKTSMMPAILIPQKVLNPTPMKKSAVISVIKMKALKKHKLVLYSSGNNLIVRISFPYQVSNPEMRMLYEFPK